MMNTDFEAGIPIIVKQGDGGLRQPENNFVANSNDLLIFNNSFSEGEGPQNVGPRASIGGGAITINGVTIGGNNDPDAFRGSLEGLTQAGNDALLAGNYQDVFNFTDKYLRNSPGEFGTGTPVSIDIAISYQLVARAGLEAETAIKNGDGVTVAGSVLTAIDEFEFLDRIGVEGAAGMAEHFQSILGTLNPSDVATAKEQFNGSFHHLGR
jgi:hypothetical protein